MENIDLSVIKYYLTPEELDVVESNIQKILEKYTDNNNEYLIKILTTSSNTFYEYNHILKEGVELIEENLSLQDPNIIADARIRLVAIHRASSTRTKDNLLSALSSLANYSSNNDTFSHSG